MFLDFTIRKDTIPRTVLKRLMNTMKTTARIGEERCFASVDVGASFRYAPFGSHIAFS